MQTAVTAYLKSKQLLLFVLDAQCKDQRQTAVTNWKSERQ